MEAHRTVKHVMRSEASRDGVVSFIAGIYAATTPVLRNLEGSTRGQKTNKHNRNTTT